MTLAPSGHEVTFAGRERRMKNLLTAVARQSITSDFCPH